MFVRKQHFFVPLACHCNAEGSESIQCSDLGVCTCKPHITGEKCDQTVPGWYDIEDPKGTYFKIISIVIKYRITKWFEFQNATAMKQV